MCRWWAAFFCLRLKRIWNISRFGSLIRHIPTDPDPMRWWKNVHGKRRLVIFLFTTWCFSLNVVCAACRRHCRSPTITIHKTEIGVICTYNINISRTSVNVLLCNFFLSTFLCGSQPVSQLANDNSGGGSGSNDDSSTMCSLLYTVRMNATHSVHSQKVRE